jgi:hypothetical protein
MPVLPLATLLLALVAIPGMRAQDSACDAQLRDAFSAHEFC